MLERLFMLIINSNSKEKSDIKVVPEMLNLLGCSKNNFKKLLKSMQYKIIEKEDQIFFKYLPKRNQKKVNKILTKENPFDVLKNLNFN